MKTSSRTTWRARAAALVLVWSAACAGPVESQARATFDADFGRATMTVFPTGVRRATVAFDREAAERLASFVRDGKYFDARSAGGEVALPGAWHMNEARMLRESAEALASWVRAHPIETRYAMMAEYLLQPDEAIGVHVYVVDAQGRIAWVQLWNSHWEPFGSLKPSDVAGCTEALLKGLPEVWAEERARAASQ